MSPIILAQERQAEYNPITKDYRPLYYFGYEPFKELSSFPEDFWIRKHLFDTQQIFAERLTDEYLQPEIIPGWFFWCNKTYGDQDPRMVGVYGISIYPSRFDVFNIKVNDTINISALLYTSFGVELYQGAKIVADYNETAIELELIQPEGNIFLLKPTYPYFNENWCYKINYKIKLLKPGDYEIKLYEELPPKSIDEAWKEEYKNKYTSGGSLLGLEIPKMKIFIYGPTPEEHAINEQEDKGTAINFPLMIVLFIILITCYIWGYYYVRRKRKSKEDEDKT